ncbi:acyltransferase family protein [Arcanobacterium phocae]|uniref:acyltransferase family protein n=1 Tax=Arcanobacterium phocae TaxID=131112 RepID=UPI001C0F37A8|nr:acyltransferase family protein [Arcanobacterium phocae]
MKEQQHGRILGLDGLRAIAALIVVVYHLIPGVADVGYIGVDMFFVISGFLITSLLMKEYETNGSISFGRFWMRRIRRLVPAVVVATVGALALARVFGGDALTQLRWQALGALTGSYNWFQIAHSSSYFDQQSPLLLNNMWSLAVEQQFYLIWPLILILIMFFFPFRVRATTAVVLAGASIALHAVTVGSDPTSAYVSTFSHSFGLMMGAGMALSLPGLLRGVRQEATAWWGYASWLALASIVALSVIVPDGELMYPWGMVLFSILTVIVIRGLLPDVPGWGARGLQGALEFRPVAWLGYRSYGIYLWHWPLHVIGFYHSPLKAFPTSIIVLFLSIIFADLSYRFIETPIRQQGFIVWVKNLVDHKIATVFGGIIFGVLLSLAVIGLLTEQKTSSGELIIRQAQEQVEKNRQQEAPQNDNAQSQEPSPAEPTPEQAPNTAAPEPENNQPSQFPEPVGSNVTIIGDSVTLAAQPAFAEALPGVIVDGAVSRSIKQFPAIAADYDSRNQLRPYVVVGLGTNVAITAADAEAVMKSVGPNRRIVFITASAPEYATWVPISNATMRDFVARYPDRVAIADWEQIALAHQDNLAGDRIHPDGDGARLLADAVSQALHSFHG